MTRESFGLQLKSCEMVTPTVRHMVFVRADGSEFVFTPGQFITFHFEWQGELYNRSYSVATIPTKTNDIEIAMSPFPGGPGTEFLLAMQPGDVINTTGPFGRLILRDEQPKRYVMVATGTGVTPYRSMLPALHQRLADHNTKVVILLGVQSPADLLYGDDFIEFAAKHPDFEFHAFYSRKMPDSPDNHEHQGYVQNYFKELNIDAENDIIYLCGNPNMIDESFKWLLDKGCITRQIRREKYISPKSKIKS